MHADTKIEPETERQRQKEITWTFSEQRFIVPISNQLFNYNSTAPSMVHGPAASASLRSSLELKILIPNPRPTESKFVF